MSVRDTSSGAVLEGLIIPVLKANRYTFSSQQYIGTSISGKRHRVDVLVNLADGLQLPISLKWQQTSGTAEEKVPFEVLKLIHAIKASNGSFPYAYIVIGGTGWSSVKDFYLRDGLRSYIVDYGLVRIISLDEFIGRANKKSL